MSTCLIIVLYRERNIANLFWEAKMANEKDLDINGQKMFQIESNKLRKEGVKTAKVSIQRSRYIKKYN